MDRPYHLSSMYCRLSTLVGITGYVVATTIHCSASKGLIYDSFTFICWPGNSAAWYIPVWSKLLNWNGRKSKAATRMDCGVLAMQQLHRQAMVKPQAIFNKKHSDLTCWSTLTSNFFPFSLLDLRMYSILMHITWHCTHDAHHMYVCMFLATTWTL